MEEVKLPAYKKGILEGIKIAAEAIDNKSCDFDYMKSENDSTILKIYKETAQDIFEDIKDCLETEFEEHLTAFEEYESCRREDNGIELCDTAEMMFSEDYKERFKAEYYQVVIRYAKLSVLLEKWDKGELNFKPTCPRAIFEKQLKVMAEYIEILDARSILEEVNL